MDSEPIYAEENGIRMFPEAKDVFSRDVEEHAEYLLPVASVSLDRLFPDAVGRIHFIIPIEPVNGYGPPGERSLEYHSYLCRPNWLAYSLEEDKCKLACDFRYFHRLYYKQYHPEGVYRQEMREIEDHYKKVRSHFYAVKSHFAKHGWVHPDPDKWDGKVRSREDAFPLFYLGGTSFDSNWVDAPDGFPVSRYADGFEDRGEYFECDNVVPQTEDGRDFVHIGRIDMWDYIGHTNGSLVLFYDPENDIALTTVDWS